MDAVATAGELTASAIAEAERMNLRIGPEALSRIRELAARAAQVIGAAPAAERSAGLAEARNAFRILLEEVARGPARPHGFAPDAVAAASVVRALDLLCPLWPFC